MIRIEKALKKVLLSNGISSYRVIKNLSFQFSQLPKESQFSSFMGLSKDLQNIRKQENKRETSEVRKHSIMLVIALAIIGSSFAFLLNDDKIQFKAHLSLLNVSSKIFRNRKQRIQNLQACLQLIDQYLQNNPYEYVISLKFLFFCSKQVKLLKEKNILQKIVNIYSFILKKNFMAGEQPMFIEGIVELTEGCLLNQVRNQTELVDLLLLKGSIKQMYLGLIYYEKESKVNSLRKNNMFLECIGKHLKDKIKQKKEYFEAIGSQKIKEYPQIVFRSKQEDLWIDHLQKTLQLPMTE